MRKLKEQRYSLPIHAKEQAMRRYDVRFSKKREKKFCEQMGGRNTVQLSKERCIVYFGKRWYLVVQKTNGTVPTFLPPNDLTSEEKERLKNDKTYRRINDDQFQVGIAVTPVLSPVPPKRKVPLPPPEEYPFEE